MDSVIPEPYISPSVKKFLSSFEDERRESSISETTSTIRVSRAASALASVYEKIRQVIDYQDENVLRRKAIERILLRRLATAKNGDESIAEGLLKEISWAHYVENNSIPAQRVQDVARIITKYKVLLRDNLYRQTKQLPDLREWVVGVLATEIEQVLVAHTVENALVKLVYDSLDTSESAPGVEEAVKNLQIYLSIQRTLLKADPAYLRYQLLVSYYPRWISHDQDTVDYVSTQFIQLVESIEYHLKHPLGDQLIGVIRRQTPPFIVLKELFERNRHKTIEILSDPEKREEEIKNICADKYQVIRTKIQRAAFRSIIYLFITKITLAFIIELPMDKLLYNEVHYLPLGVNILFPPILMFMVALGIRAPGVRNTDRILKRINLIVDNKGDKEIIKVAIPPTKSRSKAYWYFYVGTIFVSFGLISYLLSYIQFNFISGALFFFFTCLVSFFAFRIQQTARELLVVDERGSLLESVFDFFFLPFLRVGRWLSHAFSKINIFIFIFDFILEAPFKIMVEIAEEWFSFVREKKDEIS